MRQRCCNPNTAHYARYGGRGIKICEQWRSFSAFLADMGPRPGPEYELDRINNDGHYEPSNCRWATRAQQMRNTSYNRLLTINGVTKPARDWAAESPADYKTIYTRLFRGWSDEDAVMMPPNRGHKPHDPMYRNRQRRARTPRLHGTKGA
jgi:hypothetical protein